MAASAFDQLLDISTDQDRQPVRLEASAASNRQNKAATDSFKSPEAKTTAPVQTMVVGCHNPVPSPRRLPYHSFLSMTIKDVTDIASIIDPRSIRHVRILLEINTQDLSRPAGEDRFLSDDNRGTE